MYIERSAVYSITMNTTPEELKDTCLVNYLEDLVQEDYAEVQFRLVGPVLEVDYTLHQDINHYGVLFKEGLHRVVMSPN